MANYYTRSVITETLLLTDDMTATLTWRGATLYPEGAGENILDGLANERKPLTRYSIVFDEGWSDLVDCYDTVEEWAENEGEDLTKYSEEAQRLMGLDEPYLLREILKANPQNSYIEMQSAWGCDKMRLDGFGGSGLTVTKKGYMYVTTTDTIVTEDGRVEFAGNFCEWDDEPWKDENDSAEAA